MDFKNWKIPVAIAAFIALILIYTGYYIVFPDISHIVSYIWMHIGLIPIDVLIVVLVIDELISKKEKETIQEKYDMIVSSFFMEMGNELISKLAIQNTTDTYRSKFKYIASWGIKDFDNALNTLKNQPVSFTSNLKGEDRIDFLMDLKVFLHENRKFLMNLINNPNLLEKEEFSALLLAIAHLSEELEYRKDLEKVSDNDYKHLVIDINRIYISLVYEWVRYLRFNKKNYPYIIHIALRTNPFDESTSIYVKD